MIDVGKDLQKAFDEGYRQGVEDVLADVYKALDRFTEILIENKQTDCPWK